MGSWIRPVPGVFREAHRRALSSDFARRVAETWLTKIILMVIGMATSVMVTRTLGPEGRGLYAAAAALAAIGIQFGNLGLHASNSHYVSRDRRCLPTLIGNSLIVSFVGGGAGSGISWLLAIVWPSLLPLQGTPLVLGLICIPFGLAYLLFQNLLLGVSQIGTYNRIELVIKLCALAAIAAVILARMVTVGSILCVTVFTSIGGFLWALRALLRCTDQKPLPSRRLFIEHVRYGLKAYLAAFAAYMVLKVDLLMVQSMMGAKQTGYYAVASGLADILYMLPTAVGAILFPRLSALSDMHEKWHLAKRMTWSLAAMMCALTATAALVANPVIRMLYGPAFSPAIAPFVVLCGSMVLYGANTVVSCYLASIGFPMFCVYAWAGVSLLNVGMNLVMIPSYGIRGAAMSSLVCYGSILLLQFSYARRAARAA